MCLSACRCVIVDLGSGSGNALAYLCKYFVALGHGVDKIIGFEVSEARCKLSRAILTRMMQDDVCVPYRVVQTDIADIDALPDNTTHSYHFDLTFPLHLREHMELLERQSPTVAVVVTTRPDVYSRRPRVWMCVARLKGPFHGGNGSASVHVFKKLAAWFHSTPETSSDEDDQMTAFYESLDKAPPLRTSLTLSLSYSLCLTVLQCVLPCFYFFH